MRTCLTAGVLTALVGLAGCSGNGGGPTDPLPPGGGNGGIPDSIVWGPRLADSGLSAFAGADDEFPNAVAGALTRAALATPNGASQSSMTVDGRTTDEMSVRVVFDEDVGNQVHEITDGARIAVRVPFAVPRQGLALATFTDLIPGIEPDLQSYPHEVLGVWAWEGEAGAFWSRSPYIPPVNLGPMSPTGTAVYEGDAAGLYASAGTATKFVAEVHLVADFGDRTVGGEVSNFRSLEGAALDDLSVMLGETGFPADGAPFTGDTTAGATTGSGMWGGRWSDGTGWSMGGTFGFTADNMSKTVLGAFTACSCD